MAEQNDRERSYFAREGGKGAKYKTWGEIIFSNLGGNICAVWITTYLHSNNTNQWIYFYLISMR